jgi:hypothetical protein
MKWEEIIAEAREAGVLAFCAEGIAVLQQVPTHAANAETLRQSGSDTDQRIHGQDREKRGPGGDGKGESAK